MGVYAGPEISSDGLVLALDAGNSKGFDAYENLLTYSKDFSAGWSSSLTVTLNNATAPDETFTAAKIQRPINSGNSGIGNSPTLSTNTNYCYSAFIKLASTPDSTYSVCSLSSANGSISPVYASISYNFATGAISSFGNLPTISGVIPYPNGWYRLYMVINTSSQTNAFLEIRPFSNNLVSDFYIWGAQLETGSTASTYYPTTASTKTRGTTWTDLSGNSNTGTLTNGPTYSSANFGSLVFDGSNDYVDLTLSPSLQFGTNDFSIEYWIYPISKVSAAPPLFTNYVGWGSGAIFLGVDHVSYPNKYSFWIDGQGAGSSTSTNITYNKWEHLVAVRDAGICKLYLNGIQDGTTINGAGIPLNGRNSSLVRIGAIQGESNMYNGRIANTKIYNRALTATEVSQNYNALRRRFGI